CAFCVLRSACARSDAVCSTDVCAAAGASERVSAGAAMARPASNPQREKPCVAVFIIRSQPEVMVAACSHDRDGWHLADMSQLCLLRPKSERDPSSCRIVSRQQRPQFRKTLPSQCLKEFCRRRRCLTEVETSGIDHGHNRLGISRIKIADK